MDEEEVTKMIQNGFFSSSLVLRRNELGRADKFTYTFFESLAIA